MYFINFIFSEGKKIQTKMFCCSFVHQSLQNRRKRKKAAICPAAIIVTPQCLGIRYRTGRGARRGSRISARGGCQGNDDLIWDGNERFLTYANTDLHLFKMFIAILCLNGVEQPFKRHQCPFFLPLRRGNLRRRRGIQGLGARPSAPPPLDPRLGATQISRFRREGGLLPIRSSGDRALPSPVRSTEGRCLPRLSGLLTLLRRGFRTDMCSTPHLSCMPLLRPIS